MKEFERDFRVPKIIKLEQNYRSHGNILDAANALIRNNNGRLGKNLWTSEGSGEPIRVYNALTDFDEAAFIVEEVKSLHRDGVALSQMAVLYRSNAQSRVLEHALFNASLAYRVYGGMRFFERQEIKHALAYLRLIANPDDDNALLRVVNFPARGIGSRTVEQLQDEAGRQGSSLWSAMLRFRKEGPSFAPTSVGSGAMPDAGKGPDRTKRGIPGFIALINGLHQACEGLPLPEIVEHMLEHSGLVAHYRAEREGTDRVENLNELVNAAASFIQEAEESGLVEFLNHASWEAGEHQAGSGQDALQLMTVHSAKGLEFHSVFLSGLEEGLFPHDNSRNETGGLEEERRLMYVALTRARRRLYLSFSQSRMLHGQTRYNIPSRFLQEVPDRARSLQLVKSREGESGESPVDTALQVRRRIVIPHPRGGGQNVGRAKLEQASLLILKVWRGSRVSELPALLQMVVLEYASWSNLNERGVCLHRQAGHKICLVARTNQKKSRLLLNNQAVMERLAIPSGNRKNAYLKATTFFTHA
jgi:DNA helicase-2/ATP-dependent DNA helicase PcrA